VDSCVFRDKTVVEIVEDLFADYAEAGEGARAWRWGWPTAVPTLGAA